MKKFDFDLETFESELDGLRDLLTLLSYYFAYSREYIEENITSIFVGYKQHGALAYACIDSVDKLIKDVQAAQALTSPAGTADPTN